MEGEVFFSHCGTNFCISAVVATWKTEAAFKNELMVDVNASNMTDT